MNRQATNLAEALRAFSPRPLDFGREDNPYYVKRDHEPLQEIRTWLLNQQEPAKFLLSGHRGSGKSTELNRLAAQPAIRERFAVVKFSVLKVLDLVDLDYIDLLFISAAITFDQPRAVLQGGRRDARRARAAAAADRRGSRQDPGRRESQRALS